MKPTSTLLYLLIALLFQSSLTHAYSKVNVKELEIRLHKVCQTECMLKFKADDICYEFCNFVHHVVDSHEQELIQLFEVTSKFEPFEWAMSDVVRFRAEHHVEDEHILGTNFFSSISKWNDYLKKREEL
mmetsp:Transcript_28409/g.40102  ORF Transcript_28409/g.40102 Transcript_28409/m.40102 type:complete len:129 (+) Transcript_28409:1-387(+)